MEYYRTGQLCLVSGHLSGLEKGDLRAVVVLDGIQDVRENVGNQEEYEVFDNG